MRGSFYQLQQGMKLIKILSTIEALKPSSILEED